MAEWLGKNVRLDFYDKTDSRILFLWFQQFSFQSLQIALLAISLSFNFLFSLSLKDLRKTLLKEDQILFVRAELYQEDCSELEMALLQ